VRTGNMERRRAPHARDANRICARGQACLHALFITRVDASNESVRSVRVALLQAPVLFALKHDQVG